MRRLVVERDQDCDSVCPKGEGRHEPGSELELSDHSRFSHPRDAIECKALPADEKRCILLDWLQDELALIVADNEEYAISAQVWSPGPVWT